MAEEEEEEGECLPGCVMMIVDFLLTYARTGNRASNPLAAVSSTGGHYGASLAAKTCQISSEALSKWCLSLALELQKAGKCLILSRCDCYEKLKRVDISRGHIVKKYIY